MPFTLRSVGGSRFGGGGVHGETQGKEDKVCGVWGNEGKIYICTNENNRLLVTDTVPRSRWAEKYDIILDSRLILHNLYALQRGVGSVCSYSSQLMPCNSFEIILYNPLSMLKY